MHKISLGIIVATIAVLGGVLFFSKNQNLLRKDQLQVSVQPASSKPQEVVNLTNGDSYTLTASQIKKTINGREMTMLAYNGSIPGPLIKVPQGAEITLTFVNATDIGSTIHSHGVRVENKFDGVPDMTQKLVQPGESFTYTLKFPDAGVYWYHPHSREDYAQELGLYGNFVVTPTTPGYWAEVDREEALFLDDILLQNGQIAPFDRQTVNHTLMGRFGNTMLINGSENYTLSVTQGERVRLYLTNAANSRVFNFAIPNTRMKVVGSDNGKYEREEWVESVIIGPSERQIIEIWFDRDGTYPIQNQTPQKTYTLGNIVVTQAPVTTSYLMIPRINQDVITAIDPLRPRFNLPADKELRLTLQMGASSGSSSAMGEHMMHGGSMMQNQQMAMGEVEDIEWEDDMGMMNTQSTQKTLTWKLLDSATGKENTDINWQFKRGDVVKVKIINDATSMHPMQHPIHIHGQKFLIVSTNGQKTPNLVWKDTALIQTGDTVELLVQMDNPGEWLIHCHIPEHMEAGMMSRFTVL